MGYDFFAISATSFVFSLRFKALCITAENAKKIRKGQKAGQNAALMPGHEIKKVEIGCRISRSGASI